MVDTHHNLLTINKAHFLMVGWGLAILLGSIIHQFFELSADHALMMWGLFSLLGIAAHALCYFSGLGRNFAVWMGLIAVGWVFTLFVFKFDNGSHVDLLADLPAAWLLLLGLGHVATAVHIDRRFYYLAGICLVVALVIELSARRMVNIDFVDEDAALLFGLAAGVPLIVASLPVFYRSSEPQATPAPVSSPL